MQQVTLFYLTDDERFILFLNVFIFQVLKVFLTF